LVLIFLLSSHSLATDLPDAVFLIAHFDNSVSVDRPEGLLLHRIGGNIVPDGISGGALRLFQGEYLAIDAREVFSPTGGAVMFWVRPHWGYYDRSGGDLVSHTFLSFSWADNGYFVLSDGWWEPLGMYDSYFVQNNNNLIHARTKILFRRDQWTHLAITWKTGAPGYVKFYVDGELSGTGTGNMKAERPGGKLYIGCDKGSFLSNDKRWADSDIDEMLIFRSPVSQEDIRATLRQQDPKWKERKFDWMKKLLARNHVPQRDAKNEIVETRAVFDEGPGEWSTEQKAKKLIARIKRAGFNVFIPCVWHGDGTRYPSNVAPPAKYKAPGDPLATLIRVAHENGIEIHPWFTTVYRSRDFLPGYRDPETPGDAFEIHRPEFRDFIVKLILEVVERYDVDGVNLDYIRTMGVTQSSYVADLYKRNYGRDLYEDSRAFDERGRMERHLREFLDRAVEDIVRRVSENGKTLKPGLVVSVDGQPIPRFLPPSDQGRQEVSWANKGLVDVIFSMHYERNPDTENLDAVHDELDDPSRLILLAANYDEVGHAPVPRDPKALTDLVRLAQVKWNNGVGIYLYSMLTDDHVVALSKGPFKETARPHWAKKRQTVPGGRSLRMDVPLR
jgi:hypothetical protein